MRDYLLSLNYLKKFVSGSTLSSLCGSNLSHSNVLESAILPSLHVVCGTVPNRLANGLG
jgi:hypothetical protein